MFIAGLLLHTRCGLCAIFARISYAPKCNAHHNFKRIILKKKTILHISYAQCIEYFVNIENTYWNNKHFENLQWIFYVFIWRSAKVIHVQFLECLGENKCAFPPPFTCSFCILSVIWLLLNKDESVKCNPLLSITSDTCHFTYPEYVF
jgi:hypothetical protein